MKKIIDQTEDNKFVNENSKKNSINEVKTRCTCKLSKTLSYLRLINKLYDLSNRKISLLLSQISSN
jgi:hypothetical protein